MTREIGLDIRVVAGTKNGGYKHKEWWTVLLVGLWESGRGACSQYSQYGCLPLAGLLIADWWIDLGLLAS